MIILLRVIRALVGLILITNLISVINLVLGSAIGIETVTWDENSLFAVLASLAILAVLTVIYFWLFNLINKLNKKKHPNSIGQLLNNKYISL